MEENLFDGSDEEFIFENHDNLHPDDMRFDTIVEKLQDIVIEPSFNEL